MTRNRATIEEQTGGTHHTRYRSGRRARSALFWLLGIFLVSQLSLSLGMEHLFPQLRDPEYGRRLLRLKSKIAEHPRRPLVLVLGSSRAAMGIRPEIIEADPEFNQLGAQRPLLFNYALVGSGPLMELMCLKRLLHDGIRPEAIILEIWPPFLYQEGPQLEEGRIDPNRLRVEDLNLLCRYYGDPDDLREEVHFSRWIPWYAHRFYLLSQSIPGWLPWANRRDFGWNGLNSWGWLPGLKDNPDAAYRTDRLANARAYYEPLLQQYRVSPLADDALREFIDICGHEGIPVTLLVMPESSEFSSWYSEEGRQRAEWYLRDFQRDTGLPLIDARRWIDDRRLLDGFHLTHEGAAEFSRRLGREVLPYLRMREAR